ncbi:hypothetical protein FRC09_007266 [Ceratobasidium sp. 395]|nr:hypothetical protein FRC09_007266 [Ceratobasidium sp. 395]
MSDRAQKTFFASDKFAIAGASKDQTKYGTRLLKWYLARSLPVTPIHPKEAELEGVDTIKSLKELNSPTTTSISIVTPPKVSLAILKEGKELGIPAFWLQPGAEDAEVIKYVEEEKLQDRVVLGGDCVLVLGDGLLAAKKASL